MVFLFIVDYSSSDSDTDDAVTTLKPMKVLINVCMHAYGDELHIMYIHA